MRLEARVLEGGETTKALVPLRSLLAFKKERGWRHLKLYSSFGNDFNRDYFAFVDGDEDRAVVGAEAHRRVGVTDVANHLADDLLHVDVGLRSDLAGDDDHAGGDHRLAGDAAVGVLGEEGVEHAIGNLVGQLIGMPHADCFASEEVFSGCHERRLPSISNRLSVGSRAGREISADPAV